MSWRADHEKFMSSKVIRTMKTTSQTESDSENPAGVAQVSSKTLKENQEALGHAGTAALPLIDSPVVCFVSPAALHVSPCLTNGLVVWQWKGWAELDNGYSSWGYSHHYLTGVEPSGGSGASFDILSSQVEDPPAHLPKEVWISQLLGIRSSNHQAVWVYSHLY